MARDRWSSRRACCDGCRCSSVLPLLAAATASVILQMLGFVLFLTAFAALGVIEPRAAWILLPALVALHLGVTIGIALVLAPFYLVARDVNVRGQPGAAVIAFFLSPVLYELELLPPGVRGLAMLNPLAGLLGLYRTVVLGAAVPPVVSLLSLAGAAWVSWSWGATLLSRVEGRIDEYC